MTPTLLLLLGLAFQQSAAPTGAPALEAAPRTAKPDRKRDEMLRVEVVCTAISGRSVYLDLGREAGFAPGDRMRLFPLDGSPRRGRISSVSRTSARAEMEGNAEGLEIGLRGEVWIPRQRLEQAAEEERAAQPAPEGEERAETEEAAPETGVAAPVAKVGVEHPPWTVPPEEWSHEQPLLAPAHGLAPEERSRRFDGRVYTSFDWTSDSVGGVDRDFESGALGFDGRIENPFGHGGVVNLDAELFGRRFTSDGDTENESKLRIDRASYSWGGVRTARDRGEVGRFLQHELPELGFLDGIEYSHQLGTSQRVGASLGYLPIPDDFFRTGDDLQAAIFFRRESPEDRRVSVAGGYQKTWHKGVADRDLFVGQAEYHPNASTSFSTSALVDYYTSGDTLKDSGLELTQIFANATHRTSGGHGVGLFLSRFRWPDLLRNEFPDVTAQDITNTASTRYGIDGWLALSAKTQLYGRLDAWSDQDDSGSGGRARVTWRDVLTQGDSFVLESFANGGKFTSSVGVRASTRRRLEHGSADLSWDTTRFEQDGVDETLLQHALRGGLEFSLGTSWFLALYAESRFGDEQDALSVGFLLQRSFD